MEVMMSRNLLEHYLPVLPVTNQISDKKNMTLGKGKKMDQLPWVILGKTSIHPVVIGNIKPATMSNLMKTSSLWRQRTFQLYRRKGQHKILLF